MLEVINNKENQDQLGQKKSSIFYWCSFWLFTYSLVAPTDSSNGAGQHICEAETKQRCDD